MYENLRDFFDDAENVSIKILTTAAILVIAYLLRVSTRFFVRKFSRNQRTVDKASRALTAVFTVVSLVTVLLVWFTPTNAMIIAVVLLGVVVFFAMKDLVIDVFSFFYITGQGPFKVGDRIEVGEVRGEVYSIGVFTFQITEIAGWLDTAQPTGRIISVPNSMVLTEQLAVTKSEFPYVWTEITLPINHDDNLEKAHKILLDAGERELEHLIAQANAQLDDDAPAEDKLTRENLEERAGVFRSSVDPTVSIVADGSGVDLTLRFLCRDDAMAAATTRVWRDVFHRLAGVDDVNFSPDTVRVENADPHRRRP